MLALDAGAVDAVLDLETLHAPRKLRPSLGDYVRTREELLQRAGDVLDWVAGGKLTVRIGGRYPLEEARRAQEDLESRRTTGKLILLPRASG